LDAISSKALDTTDAEEITIKGRKRSKSTIKKAKKVRQPLVLRPKSASSSEEDRDSFSDNETESSDDNIDSYLISDIRYDI
jgi:hypothetical protein